MENYEKVWRAFDDTKITHSVAHYLFAIKSLEAEDQSPRAADIAKKLSVSRNAVSLQMKSLLKGEYVYLDESRRIHLTPRGLDAVNLISGIRLSFKTFLTEVLDIDEETAERDSCKVEHLLSETTGAAFARLLAFIRKEPEFSKKFTKKFRDSFSKIDCGEDGECGMCEDICLMHRNEEETRSEV